jgi:hypothetical protein
MTAQLATLFLTLFLSIVGVVSAVGLRPLLVAAIVLPFISRSSCRYARLMGGLCCNKRVVLIFVVNGSSPSKLSDKILRAKRAPNFCGKRDGSQRMVNSRPGP